MTEHHNQNLGGGASLPTTPYGRHTDRAPGRQMTERQRQRADERPRPYQEGYYDLPMVKPSPWGWLITGYFFLGGLAGAAQIIATVADLCGGPGQRTVVRAGRYLGFAGAVISPVLLILDLHVPSRWYAMLRIVRRTSPMSVGSWILAAFGAASSTAALAQAHPAATQSRCLQGLARLSGLFGAIAGAGMATYTATLLTATSTPLWLASAQRLPILFGATAMASAVAAISLALDATRDRTTNRRPLHLLGTLAALAQLWAARELEATWRNRDLKLTESNSLSTLDQFGVRGAGMILPLTAHAASFITGRSMGLLGSIVSLATLVGAFAERGLIVFGGNRSAVRPGDYARLSG